MAFQAVFSRVSTAKPQLIRSLLHSASTEIPAIFHAFSTSSAHDFTALFTRAFSAAAAQDLGRLVQKENGRKPGGGAGVWKRARFARKGAFRGSSAGMHTRCCTWKHAG
jgi:hypothetical protein